VRKRNDFFVKHLLGLNPPNWNDMAITPPATASDNDEPNYAEIERAPFFQDWNR
jgi:hypothetical protein